jgi:hypothetical protein
MRDGGKPQHSWHEFYGIHPAAAFYHGFSSHEQLEELRADIDKQQVIFDQIHTATVFGKSFVIDGISRLDQAEKTGRQIVDEKGNWIGMLDGHVVHHSGKTDAQVWAIVSSLNLKRRHLTKEQILEVADQMLELEAAEKGAAKNDRTTTTRSFSPNPGTRGGSTKDPRKAALKKRAQELAGESVSDSTVDNYLRRNRSGKAPRKPKKEPSFENQVYKKWTQWLKRFPHEKRREVTNLVHEWTAPIRKEGASS